MKEKLLTFFAFCAFCAIVIVAVLGYAWFQDLPSELQTLAVFGIPLILVGLIPLGVLVLLAVTWMRITAQYGQRQHHQSPINIYSQPPPMQGGRWNTPQLPYYPQAPARQFEVRQEQGQGQQLG